MIDVHIYFTIYDGYSNSPSWSKSRWVHERVSLAGIPHKGDYVSIGEYIDSEVVAVTYNVGGKIDIDLGKLYAAAFAHDNDEPMKAEELQQRLIAEIELARNDNEAV